MSFSPLNWGHTFLVGGRGRGVSAISSRHFEGARCLPHLPALLLVPSPGCSSVLRVSYCTVTLCPCFRTSFFGKKPLHIVPTYGAGSALRCCGAEQPHETFRPPASGTLVSSPAVYVLFTRPPDSSVSLTQKHPHTNTQKNVCAYLGSLCPSQFDSYNESSQHILLRFLEKCALTCKSLCSGARRASGLCS